MRTISKLWWLIVNKSMKSTKYNLYCSLYLVYWSNASALNKIEFKFRVIKMLTVVRVLNNDENKRNVA